MNIAVKQSNAAPWPPCDMITTQRQLFGETLLLKNLVDALGDFEDVLARSLIAKKLKEEEKRALEVDPLQRDTRTEILYNLSQFGNTCHNNIGLPNIAFTCSSSASYHVQMKDYDNYTSVGFRQSLSNDFHFTLIAYDPDEDRVLRYVIDEAPRRGNLFFLGQCTHERQVMENKRPLRMP
jgi:hypothetical protein